ncbi:MAG: amidohydrolase family protein [Bacteroidota bacterium]
MGERYHIANGVIYDGRGGEGFQGDLLLANGKVEAVSKSSLPQNQDYQFIDATGMWVTPGFIDIHTHYDGEVEIAPELSESVRHGVTSILMGSCGISMVMGDPEELSDMFTRVEGMPSHYIKEILKQKKDWDGPAEYLQHLEGLALGPNIGLFLGHSTLRAYVMGLSASLSSGNQPTKKELDKMSGILSEALNEGYLGLSINLLEFDKMDGTEFRSLPTPSVFANWKEYRHLFRQLRERDRILQTVPNSANPSTFFSFIWESRGLFRKPLKTSMLAMIDGKTVRGIHRIFGNSARFANRFLGANVKFQGLPEPFDVVTHGFESPFFEEFETGTDYLHLQEVAERRELLDQSSYRKRFRKQWKQRFAPRVFHRDLKDTAIVSCPDEALNGRSFRELAKEQGRDEIDYFLDKVQEYGDDLRWYTVVGNDRPHELNWIINHPDCHIGFSDAGAHLRNMAHYNFPLRLLHFVRQQKAEGRKTLSIGQAIFKLTKELADWYLLDTGTLEKGRSADVVVLNPAHLNDQLEETHQEGMPGLASYQRLVRRNDDTVRAVFVNGKLAWQTGQASPSLGREKLGRVLRAQ